MTAIAREKAAIIERGDLAVTGADGDGLAVVRRRAAAARRAAHRGTSGANPRLGSRRHRGRAWAARSDEGLVARPTPGGQRGDRRRRARCARGRRDRQHADRRQADRLCDRGLAGAPRADQRERTGRAPRRCPQSGRRRRAGGRARRPRAVPERRTDHAGHRVDGRQGRRRRDRGHRTRRGDGRRHGHLHEPGPVASDGCGRAGGTLAPASADRHRPRRTGPVGRPGTSAGWLRRAATARSSWPVRSILSGPRADAWSTTRTCATRASPRTHDPPARRRGPREPRADADRAGHVQLGRADVRHGHRQRHARLLLRRRPPGGRGRSGRGRGRARAPDGGRRRRPARRRRRIHAPGSRRRSPRTKSSPGSSR